MCAIVETEIYNDRSYGSYSTQYIYIYRRTWNDKKRNNNKQMAKKLTETKSIWIWIRVYLYRYMKRESLLYWMYVCVSVHDLSKLHWNQYAYINRSIDPANCTRPIFFLLHQMSETLFVLYKRSARECASEYI